LLELAEFLIELPLGALPATNAGLDCLGW